MAKSKTTSKSVVSKGKATRPTFVDGDKGKHDRFVFYVNLRVNKAVKLFKQLGNLSNRTIYAYTPQEAAKVITALETSLAALKVKLSNTPEAKKADTFRIDN